MPLCQDANVLQFFTSSSEDVPKGDRMGLTFNFQPLNSAWRTALARLAVRRGFKEIAVMGIHNDFTTSMIDTFRTALEAAAGRLVNSPSVYKASLPSYHPPCAPPIS